MIDLDLVKRSLQKVVPRVVFFECVESTNLTARDLVLEDPFGPTLVLAETQTRGRGRYDRIWVSPKGGLYMSLILSPKCASDKYTLFNLLAGCAVCHSIRKLYGLNALLKWPNDILINSRKVVGILSEVITDSLGVPWVIIGIGINANVRTVDYSPELHDKLLTLQDALHKPVDLNELIITTLQSLFQRITLLENGNHAAILDEWRRMNATLGHKVTVIDGENEITGLALDITESGSLLLQTAPDSIVCVNIGDIIHC